jgi:hypothetical protein
VAIGTSAFLLFDRLLITYWERPRFLFTDQLNKLFLLLVLIAILPSFFFGMFIGTMNDCIWAKGFRLLPIKYQNEFSVCSDSKDEWQLGYTTFASAFLLFVVSILGEKTLCRKLKCCKRKEENQVTYEKLSPVQSMIILAEELARR